MIIAIGVAAWFICGIYGVRWGESRNQRSDRPIRWEPECVMAVFFGPVALLLVSIDAIGDAIRKRERAR